MSTIAASAPSIAFSIAAAAASSSDAHAAASPAHTRISNESATPRTSRVSVCRTLPYRSTRASGWIACMSCCTSPVVADRCSSAAVTAASAAGRSASTTASTRAVISGSCAAPAARSDTTAAAAACTVVPYRARSMSPTRNSGCQRSRQPSLNVPSPRAAATVPHGTPSSRSRCSSADRARSVSPRRSSSTSLAAACGRNRSRRHVASKSACSGTTGTSGGTAPRSSPTTSCRWISCNGTSSPWHKTAWVASVSSVSPGRDRPRTAAVACASRTASSTAAVEAGISAARSSRAARTTQRSAIWSGVRHRCPYQPGDATPAP